MHSCLEAHRHCCSIYRGSDALLWIPGETLRHTHSHTQRSMQQFKNKINLSSFFSNRNLFLYNSESRSVKSVLFVQIKVLTGPHALWISNHTPGKKWFGRTYFNSQFYSLSWHRRHSGRSSSRRWQQELGAVCSLDQKPEELQCGC